MNTKQLFLIVSMFFNIQSCFAAICKNKQINPDKISKHVQFLSNLEWYCKYNQYTFLSECKNATLEEAKKIVEQVTSEHSSVSRDGAIKLLASLEKALKYEIAYIESQIKHKYRFDQRTLKESFILVVVTLGLCMGTFYAYKRWSEAVDKKIADQEEFDENRRLRIKDHKKFAELCRMVIGDMANEDMANKNRVEACAKIRALDARIDAFDVELQTLLNGMRAVDVSLVRLSTVLLAGGAGLMSAATLKSLYDLAMIDPNNNNRHISMYQDLLKYVMQLQAEYAVK